MTPDNERERRIEELREWLARDIVGPRSFPNDAVWPQSEVQAALSKIDEQAADLIDHASARAIAADFARMQAAEIDELRERCKHYADLVPLDLQQLVSSQSATIAAQAAEIERLKHDKGGLIGQLGELTRLRRRV